MASEELKQPAWSDPDNGMTELQRAEAFYESMVNSDLSRDHWIRWFAIFGNVCSIAELARANAAIKARREAMAAASGDPAQARGDRALIDGAETWRLLDELVSRGYTKGSLARWLGFVRPAVQFHRRVTVRTAVRVRKLYDDLNAGRIRREA